MDDFAGEWILTLDEDGVTYLAHRPVGWAGPRPHERITAPTRETLLWKIHQRNQSGLTTLQPRSATP